MSRGECQQLSSTAAGLAVDSTCRFKVPGAHLWTFAAWWGLRARRWGFPLKTAWCGQEATTAVRSPSKKCFCGTKRTLAIAAPPISDMQELNDQDEEAAAQQLSAATCSNNTSRISTFLRVRPVAAARSTSRMVLEPLDGTVEFRVPRAAAAGCGTATSVVVHHVAWISSGALWTHQCCWIAAGQSTTAESSTTSASTASWLQTQSRTR